MVNKTQYIRTGRYENKSASHFTSLFIPDSVCALIWCAKRPDPSEKDVKTVQELLRHANSRITLEVYTQAVTSNKRAAQHKVIRMMIPDAGQNAVRRTRRKLGLGFNGSLLDPDFLSL